MKLPMPCVLNMKGMFHFSGLQSSNLTESSSLTPKTKEPFFRSVSDSSLIKTYKAESIDSVQRTSVLVFTKSWQRRN